MQQLILPTLVALLVTQSSAAEKPNIVILDKNISQAKNIYHEHPEQVEKLTALMKKIVDEGTRSSVEKTPASQPMTTLNRCDVPSQR
jgi:hypothetical protein